MKVAIPLSLKVTLWLLLNLVVLVAAGGLFVAARYGVGWEALVAGPAGERIRQLEHLVSSELRANPRQSLDDLLASHADGAAELLLFRNDGTQVGGPTVLLPPAVLRELRAGPPHGARPAPPPRAAEADPPPSRPDDPPPPPPDGPPSRGRPASAFAFLRHAGTPSAYWIGLRTPIHRADGRLPDRGTLIVRVPSTFDLLRLLDFDSWLLAVAVAFVLSVACWLPFVGSLRRALLSVTRTTEAIAEGRLETRIDADRRDELGVLGRAVNQMAGRLQAQAQEQKRFLGDVAHELGTPLGRLQVAVELLERDAAPALQPRIADVREEVQHVATLVNELLAFTRAELRPRGAVLGPVELAPLCARVLDREGVTGRVGLELSPGLVVRADPVLLERALGNLVRNTRRYAPDDDATLRARALDDQFVLIEVADDGPGVPDEALARLGEPFFRPDTARARETGGSGLGLAIVRTCIEACGGSLRFRNRDPHGFVAELRLVRAP